MNPSPPAPPLVPPAPKLVEVTEYYRGQVVLADVAGLLAAGLVGSKTNSGWALLLYFLASPTVHVAHGNTGRAFGSLGLHVLMPLVGTIGAIATSAHCGGDGGCGPSEGAAAAWVLGGLAAATVLDAVFLANVTRIVEQPGQAHLAPFVLPTKAGGATFGLAATF